MLKEKLLELIKEKMTEEDVEALIVDWEQTAVEYGTGIKSDEVANILYDMAYDVYVKRRDS